jgi:hypothetical protein
LSRGLHPDGQADDLNYLFPARRCSKPANGIGDHTAFRVTKHPVMENRFSWKPDVELQNVLFQTRDTMLSIEESHTLELAAQMWVQVYDGMTKTGVRPR